MNDNALKYADGMRRMIFSLILKDQYKQTLVFQAPVKYARIITGSNGRMIIMVIESLL